VIWWFMGTYRMMAEKVTATNHVSVGHRVESDSSVNYGHRSDGPNLENVAVVAVAVTVSGVHCRTTICRDETWC